eukprot:COSAG02_NODE_26514_length_631_cov_0.966165_1_plen_78_part_01
MHLPILSKIWTLGCDVLVLGILDRRTGKKLRGLEARSSICLNRIDTLVRPLVLRWRKWQSESGPAISSPSSRLHLRSR